MKRRMLINAQKPEEVRIAVVAGDRLQDFQVELAEREQTRGNIYRGIVAAVHPSLNAAFIDFGDAKNGFLPMQDLVDQAHHRKSKGRARIEDVLEKGKPILVQVTKEFEGQKGAALTTNISLAGRYLVFTPFDDVRGVSRKVEDEETRKKLKEQAGRLDVPAGAGFIIRTNALDQTKTTLNRDFNAIMRLWKQIETASKKGKEPKLLHAEQDIVVRTLRDYLDSSIDEILIDDDDAYEAAREYMRVFMPRGKTKLVRYDEREPMFSRFRIEAQVEEIYQRSVDLASGGSIVIDRTEALHAIDVNSGRSTQAHNREEMAYQTNLEAAAEVARQLRMRDIGGLIVVDFIDMRSRKHRQAIEKTVKEAMKEDKARFSVGRISDNGLLEINRQRIRQALHLRTHRPCPTCDGTGRIASPEMVGLNLMRRIEARASTTPLRLVRIGLHPELADSFQNTRRREIVALEEEFDLRIEVIAASHLHRPEQEIEWFPREGTGDDSKESVGRVYEEKKKKKKKRRGDRAESKASELKPEPKPVMEEEKTPAPEAKQADEPPSEAKKPRKKRRRRAKGTGEPAATAEAQPVPESPESPESVQHDESPEAVALASESSASAKEGEPKKGRRRRRRRGSKNGAAKEPMPPSDESETPMDGEAEWSAWIAPPGEGESEEQASAAPKRRKRRRSRRRPAGEANGEAGSETSQEPSEE